VGLSAVGSPRNRASVLSGSIAVVQGTRPATAVAREFGASDLGEDVGDAATEAS
jgi:hypothetical protein